MAIYLRLNGGGGRDAAAPDQVASANNVTKLARISPNAPIIMPAIINA